MNLGVIGKEYGLLRFCANKALIVGLILLTPILINAQAPAMQQYSVDHGLPSSHVYTAFEDSKGFIWLGTDKGLARFDGYEFEVFDLSEFNGSNEIWDLQEDNKGRIWCSTFNNILYFENEKFHTVPLPKHIQVASIERYFLKDTGNHMVLIYSASEYQLLEIHLDDPLSLSLFKIPQLVSKTLNFVGVRDDGSRLFLNSTSTTGHDKYINIILEKAGEFKIYNKPFNDYPANSKFDIPNLEGEFSDFQIYEDLYFSLKDLSFHSYESQLKEPTKIQNYQHSKNISLLTTDDGYKLVDKDLQPIPGYDFLNDMNVNSVMEDSYGNKWICTSNLGVYFLSAIAQKSITLPFDDLDFNDRITSITLDHSDHIILGQNNGNLLKIDAGLNKSQISIEQEEQINSISSRRYNFILQDELGNFHLTFDCVSLIIFRKEGLVVKQQKLEQANKIGCIKFYLLDRDGISWMATSHGVYKVILRDSIFIQRIFDERTYSLANTNDLLWMGTVDGLYTRNIANLGDTIIQKDEHFISPIFALAADKNQNVWVAPESKGLFYYDGIHIDTLSEFIESKEVISKFFTDEDENLWVASNNGISKIKVLNRQPFKYQLQRYSLTNGLPTMEVSHIVVRDNKIYAMTAKGLTILEENPTIQKAIAPPLYFTRLTINNKPRSLQDNYNLSFDENNIKFNYSCLSYQSLRNIRYDFIMEGVDDKWRSTEEAQITYNTLTPGNYTFKIKATDIDKLSTELNSISLKIRPPWWKTWLAYLIYALLLGSLLYLFYNMKLKQNLAKQEALRMKEVDHQKNQLFANISHEFRTPLTLIQGMAEKIRSNGSSENREAANMIIKHETKLLHLINQVLDLTKLRAGKITPNWVQMDIIPAIRSALDSFHQYAESKDINLKFHSESEKIIMDFDIDKLQTILFNLISNALKYTAGGGSIMVKVDFIDDSKSNAKNNYLILSVEDTGYGIPQNALPMIFDRYYHASPPQHSHIDAGTGIGLALTKELTEMLFGKIEAKSVPGKGTIMKVYLPITNTANSSTTDVVDNNLSRKVDAIFSEQNVSADHLIESPNGTVKFSADPPNLLIIEDDADMAVYLQDLLNSQYNIQLATNGRKGMELAIESIPDLIISDVMMPGMNGFDLCGILKEDARTGHIPIILLTAKATEKNRLEGLTLGADAYLTKPFSRMELKIRLRKLWELRLNLQKRYAASSEIIRKIALSEEQAIPEDLFILRLQNIVQENIDNPEFDVPAVCKAIGMSRTQLHNKVTAMTGASITKFIRKIRLEKAAALLKSSDLPIANIAYQTGLDPKNFSAIFKRVYKVTPGQYRKGS